jgi:hypothetical protein
VQAYAAQKRLDELRKRFGSRINIQCHYIPVFGGTQARIGERWKDKGCFVACGRYVMDVTKRFDYIDRYPFRCLDEEYSAFFAGCHVFLKFIRVLEEKGEISNKYRENHEGGSLVKKLHGKCGLLSSGIWRHCPIGCAAQNSGAAWPPLAAIMRQIENGEAYAALCLDSEQIGKYKIEGSMGPVIAQVSAKWTITEIV